MSTKRNAAVFVLGVTTSGQQGPVGAWLSAAGWAAAARSLLGEAWIVTPEGAFTPEQARARATHTGLAVPAEEPFHRKVPLLGRTAAKDVREFVRGQRFDVPVDGMPWAGCDVAFVWQRHSPFHTAGLRLGRRLQRPTVLFVPAPMLWEARQWGLHRPGYGWLLERGVERRRLLAADVVCCGSEEVANVVRSYGLREERIVVTPNGVDTDFFHPGDATELRKELGLEDRFVVGWAGSFRPFHAVELAIEAAASLRNDVPNITLLLLGDGPERPHMEQLAAEMGVDARFTGTVPHADMPRHLNAFDVALVLHRRCAPFHYSPLKLWEYLACGRAVIAPGIGEPTRRLADGVDVVLVPPGDSAAVADAVRSLATDPEMRTALERTARAHVLQRGSWETQLHRLLGALGVEPASPR